MVAWPVKGAGQVNVFTAWLRLLKLSKSKRSDPITGGGVKSAKGFRRAKWGNDTPQKGHGKSLARLALFLCTLTVAAAVMTPPRPNWRCWSEAGQLLGLNWESGRYAAETSTQCVLNEMCVELDEGILPGGTRRLAKLPLTAGTCTRSESLTSQPRPWAGALPPLAGALPPSFF